MVKIKDMNLGRILRAAPQASVYAAALVLVAASAIVAKEHRGEVRPLASIVTTLPTEPVIEPVAFDAQDEDVEFAPPADEQASDTSIRWFNGRPVRPARIIWMTVTGYSPDERSCGDSADGLTATLHSVYTNNMRMVAADTRLLPFGSMLTVPGYDSGQIVPVLDRGGAIKGRKLDLLFATHEQALKWGRKKIAVTVWEYADGKPSDDPRKFR